MVLLVGRVGLRCRTTSWVWARPPSARCWRGSLSWESRVTKVSAPWWGWPLSIGTPARCAASGHLRWATGPAPRAVHDRTRGLAPQPRHRSLPPTAAGRRQTQEGRALEACMRKLLTILNAMVRSGKRSRLGHRQSPVARMTCAKQGERSDSIPMRTARRAQPRTTIKPYSLHAAGGSAIVCARLPPGDPPHE